MTRQHTSYVRNLTNTTTLYQRIDEAIARRIKEAESDRTSLERSVNQALRSGNYSKAEELMQPYATKYLPRPEPVPRSESVTPTRKGVVKYDEELPMYVAQHPKDSYAKQELKDFMRAQIQDRRINSALIAREMGKLGYKSAGDNYVKQQRKKRKR